MLRINQNKGAEKMRYCIVEITDEDENLIPHFVEIIVPETRGQP